MRRPTQGLILFMVLALLSGCAGTLPLVPTRFQIGTALKDLNNQVVETDKLYVSLNEAKAVTPDEFLAWKKFVTRYKVTEASMYALWNAGESGSTADLLDALRREVRTFLLAVATRRIPIRFDEGLAGHVYRILTPALDLNTSHEAVQALQGEVTT